LKSEDFSIRHYLKEETIKGLVIAGTKSGSGKTTITLGLLAAFLKRGLRVASFKVGPDFIDPGHHTSVTGIAGSNLDGWMLSKDYNLKCFAQHSRKADIAVVEGVMGLFDGYDGKSEAGSTAQMAKWLNLPVLLIVDARSMARSAAALVQGFERFDREVTFAGVVFNNLGSQRHWEYLKEALDENVDMPCLGGIIRNESIRLPERHLGLVTREDCPLSTAQIDCLAELLEESLQLDQLLEKLPEISNAIPSPQPEGKIPPGRVRIGVARDRAFCFYYPDNLEMLKFCGAELIYFSPVADRSLPENLDGLYLGGGYPELAAGELAENEQMQRQILQKSHAGMPIFSECGGFMYLCREICSTGGERFPMVGCFPFQARMYDRLKSLGYREITLSKPAVIGDTGLRARGHEFHYSEIDTEIELSDIETVFTVTARAGLKKPSTGYQIRRTLGSYIHLHFGSQPEVGKRFVENCLIYQQER
jgi:cobyrinic acid a,c-diamide synthase